MITHFCPFCWSIIPEKVKTCPDCGELLCRYNDRSIEEKYILALRHPITENRILAAMFLGESESRQALPEFERMLREEKEYYVLREVVLALTRIRDPQACELLKVALDHPYSLISQLAKRFLDQLKCN